MRRRPFWLLGCRRLETPRRARQIAELFAQLTEIEMRRGPLRPLRRGGLEASHRAGTFANRLPELGDVEMRLGPLRHERRCAVEVFDGAAYLAAGAAQLAEIELRNGPLGFQPGHFSQAAHCTGGVAQRPLDLTKVEPDGGRLGIEARRLFEPAQGFRQISVTPGQRGEDMAGRGPAGVEARDLFQERDSFRIRAALDLDQREFEQRVSRPAVAINGTLEPGRRCVWSLQARGNDAGDVVGERPFGRERDHRLHTGQRGRVVLALKLDDAELEMRRRPSRHQPHDSRKAGRRAFGLSGHAIQHRKIELIARGLGR